MRIGIAYDLKADFAPADSCPEDCLDEYDSEETVEAIAAALRAAAHEPVRLGGGRRFLEAALRASSGGPALDLVFNIAEGHGSRSREAHVPAVCEMLELPHTHSDPLTLAVSLDKALTKRVVASHGLRTAPCCLIERIEELARAPLPPFPVMVKLNGEGSSIGIRRQARCDTRADLAAHVGWLLTEYGQRVLVEQFLPGVEVTVAILGTGAGARVVGSMEIAPRRSPPADFIYSLHAKRNYREEVAYRVPPRLSAPTLGALEVAALGAYRALGCRDVGRVDLRLDGEGEPHFLEINPLPGLHPVTGDLPICCALAGMPYVTVIAGIVERALSRQSPASRGRLLRAL